MINAAHILSILVAHNRFINAGMKPWVVVPLFTHGGFWYFDTLVEAEKFMDGDSDDWEPMEIRGWDESKTEFSVDIYHEIVEAEPDYEAFEAGCVLPGEAELASAIEQVRPMVHVELRKMREHEKWEPKDEAAAWLHRNG